MSAFNSVVYPDNQKKDNVAFLPIIREAITLNAVVYTLMTNAMNLAKSLELGEFALFVIKMSIE